jgi:hypothetical protein
MVHHARNTLMDRAMRAAGMTQSGAQRRQLRAQAWVLCAGGCSSVGRQQ